MISDYKNFLELNKIAQSSGVKCFRVVDFDINFPFVVLEDLDTKKKRSLALIFFLISVENKSFWVSNPSKLKIIFKEV